MLDRPPVPRMIDVMLHVMMVDLITSFHLAFLATVIFRKNECAAAAINCAILAYQLRTMRVTRLKGAAVVLFGFSMAAAELTCVKWFDMWEYKHVRGDVPAWLPFTWSIAGVFAGVVLV